MKPDLRRLLHSPTGWVKDDFDIVHPPLEHVEITVGPLNGVEIRTSGVYLIENGVRRKATRKEALRARAGFRQALGEEISDAAGVEPE